ncbi:hypothetical protein Trydic_g12531 [Trypoxylus dichotomus]
MFRIFRCRTRGTEFSESPQNDNGFQRSDITHNRPYIQKRFCSRNVRMRFVIRICVLCMRERMCTRLCCYAIRTRDTEPRTSEPILMLAGGSRPPPAHALPPPASGPPSPHPIPPTDRVATARRQSPRPA